MPWLVTDTHALLWFVMRSPRLSPIALERLRGVIASGASIYVPTICLVEVIYLADRGRLPPEVGRRIRNHLGDAQSGLELVPLGGGVAETLRRVPREQVRDMPDRIIAATALYLGLPLVTRDARVRAAGIEVVW